MEERGGFTLKNERTNPRTRMLKAFLRNRAAVVGLLTAVLLILLALFAPYIAPHDPTRQSAPNRFKEPGTPGFVLGTDRYGRDILSRILWGSRISLQVGIASVALGLVIGAPLGITAAYKGGWYDAILMRLVDMALSFPTLVLGLIILSLMGPGISKVILTIGFVLAPRFARIARGPTLALMEEDFVLSARSLGASDTHIIIFHIFPNVIGDIVVVSALWIATAIRVEASLSFLGLGVQPPIPTWGNMIRAGIRFLGNAPWMALFPAVAIFLAILSFNMIGDGLRDITDPKIYSN